MLSSELLEILCCPACHGDLRYAPDEKTLTCLGCKRVYPIVDDIPILLIDQATVVPPTTDDDRTKQ